MYTKNVNLELKRRSQYLGKCILRVMFLNDLDKDMKSIYPDNLENWKTKTRRNNLSLLSWPAQGILDKLNLSQLEARQKVDSHFIRHLILSPEVRFILIISNGISITGPAGVTYRPLYNNNMPHL